MRVLLVCHRYPPAGVAGVERLSAQAAAGLRARGHEVTVLTRHEGEASTLTLERRDHHGVRVVSIGGRYSHEDFPRDEPVLERAFERMLAELSPDVVLATHLMHHSPGYVTVAHRWRLPVVLELHDFFGLCPRAHLERTSGELCGGPEGGRACAEHCFSAQEQALLRWALRSQSFAEALRRADAVLAPSAYVAERFAARRGDGAPIEVIANGVTEFAPVLRPPPDPAAPLRLASIGPTVEHKGFGVTIEALRLAQMAARYTVFGVALQPGLDELVEAADHAPDLELELFGEFEPSHLPALLADVDALVVPSLVPETFSIVAREAFALGLPVIASRIGALGDAIRPGDNGWLFEPGDALGLADLLRQLGADRSPLRRAAAGIRAEDMPSVADRLDRVEAILLGAIEHSGAGGDWGRETELALMREALAAR